MNKYESIFIISTLVDEDQIKEHVEKFSNLISENGELEKVEEWGRKKLAYEVQDQKEGYYVMVTFSAKAEFPAELERNFKISEHILKYIIIRKDK